MPKPRTNPLLLDEVKVITIRSLKKLGYFRPGQKRCGMVYWSEGSIRVASISIMVNMYGNSHFLVLTYVHERNHISYHVPLASIRSNLGHGRIWYFVCPETRKRCRKLYLIDNRFSHRSAAANAMYFKQTLSHKDRKGIRLLDIVKKAQSADESITSRYFKRCYKGRPTKRYLQLMEIIAEGGSITLWDIEGLYLR